MRKLDLHVYIKMYCQGIKFGCPDAALLGIRVCDLVHPSIILADGNKYTYVYFISCQGKVTKKGTGQQALNKYDCTCAQDLSCAELHAKIEKSKGHAVWYGRMRAADAQQWAKLHPQSGGLFNASAAVTAATMHLAISAYSKGCPYYCVLYLQQRHSSGKTDRRALQAVVTLLLLQKNKPGITDKQVSMSTHLLTW